MNSSDMAKSFTVATTLAVLLLAAGAHRLPSEVPLRMPRRLWLAGIPATSLPSPCGSGCRAGSQPRGIGA